MFSFQNSEFEESKIKSSFIHQYKCKKCKNTWWGKSINNSCKGCNEIVEKLPLTQMIGVAWFECPCGRRYAGFCRGDVTSKCHVCEKKNLPLFIVPGDKVEGKKTYSHHCSMCNGSGHCPIVASAQRKRR